MQLSHLMEQIPQFYSRSIKLPCTAVAAQTIIRTLKDKYIDNQPITIDGLRIDWIDCWVLIRPSNTESVIRLYAEAKSLDKLDQLLQDFQTQIENLI